AYVVIDMNHRDKNLLSEMNVIDKKHISGMRRSEAWAKDQYCFFYAEFSEEFIVQDARMYFIKKDPNFKGRETGVLLSFNTKTNQKILVKVGISFVSEEGAKQNLEKEITGWDFEKTKTDAKAEWEKELGKIIVEGTDDSIQKFETRKKIFYTELYHCMIQPNITNDVDGKYRGRDNLVHTAEGHNYYSVFSLWDTFRGEHPLFTIIDRKRTSDFIKTFLLQYQQGGRLPVWELASNETDCMIGYHSASVIADAMTKGIRNFDVKLALEAMKKSATWNHLGLPAYANQGYLAAEDEHESVSKTLEYAYDDWCIAKVAELLNKKDDYVYYMRRSQSWKNMLDPETDFMRPRKNGGWLSPFDPKEVNNYFTEGNSWQYSFFVPQDVNGLIKAMGGNEAFEKKLDLLFSEDSKTTGREQADITGLIGQYAHGNEPSHHMAYLYNYIDRPYKTQALVKKILNEMYKPGPDGLSGNEDCGQMSAWYVLSSMGFYQVCPGSGFFDIGYPAFDKVTINLENGKQFVMTVKNPETRNYNACGLKNVSLGGQNLKWAKVSYERIMQGDKLEMSFTANPKEHWENSFETVPGVNKDFQEIWRVPAIVSSSAVFRDSLLIEIKNYEDGKILL
ncbi:MAG: glycoside hydrolase family 92 protein, partial [Bacteroidia bacterium]|nr:glycoside hydrolase family 92 protein [Bacteroidia bacterium]